MKKTLFVPTAVRGAFATTVATASFAAAAVASAATVSAAVATSSAAPASAAQAKPNIILITVDDLGLQLSCYGDPYIKTPNLDALAGSGVRFVTTYTPQACCSPARAGLLTGLYPHANGQIGLAQPPMNFSMRADNTPPTLPTLLKQAGYRTAIMGKLHVFPVSAFSFDENLLPPKQMRDVRKAATLAADFIKRSDGDPFFLYINYADPHKALGEKPPGFPAQVKGIPANPFKPGDIPAWPFQRVENNELLKHIANYYNCALRIDAGIGMLMDALKASGKYDNTIIVFIADHGPPFARAKTSCYEAGLHIPLLIRWPGVSKAGLASAAMACSIDIMPTLLEAAGVPAPKMQGRSLKAALQGDDAGKRVYMAAEFNTHTGSFFFPRRAIRDDRYKLIYNMLAGRAKASAEIDGDTASVVAASAKYNGTPAQKAMSRLADPPMWELYDLSADPFEFNNLADDPVYQPVLARLKKALAAWQDETEDPYRDPKKIDATMAEITKKWKAVSRPAKG